MLHIDGSEGEGGGQILRSALSLSMCTGQPFQMTRIRANRQKPGLMRQHLTAVQASAAICGADVSGDTVGSGEITFRPGKVVAGNYEFSIGTAGSCTLVLQTLLPPLLAATAPSTVRLMGGTHNKAAPPVDFLQRAFLPLLARMGAKVSIDLVRHGFYPRGGGEILATITPAGTLAPLDLMDRGSKRGAYAEAYVAAVPAHVAKRELEMVGKMLNWPEEHLHVRGLTDDLGPGNAMTLTVGYEHITAVFTGFGEKGLSAESVAKGVIGRTRRYLTSTVAVDEHLADQLLLPMALHGGGKFSTFPVSEHFNSQASVIRLFLNRNIITSSQSGVVHVGVG